MVKVSSHMWQLILGGVGVLLLFVGFSYLVHLNVFIHLDFDTTVRLQDRIPRRVDGIFSFLSDIGKFEIVSIFLLVVTAAYLFVYKKWLVPFAAFFFYGLFHFIELYGKTFVHHLPPPHFMLRTHDVFTFPEFYVQATNSYPSGHAGRALFVTVLLAIIVGKVKKISRTQKVCIYAFLAIYDIAMLTSRIYLGEHWLSDIIGGSILGISMGLFAVLFL